MLARPTSRPSIPGLLSPRLALPVLLASTLLASGAQALAETADGAASETAQVGRTVSSQALRAALSQAAAYGRGSLLASIVENTRLTPGRAAVIDSEARALRPDLAASIARAVASGRHLAGLFPEASIAATPGIAKAAAQRTSPYPGGNPDIPKDTLNEYQRNYSLDAMHADAAIRKGITGKGVVVGVIDTGIDRRPDGSVHPEFEGRVDPRSVNYLHWFDTNLAYEDLTVAEFEAGFEQGPTDTYDIDGHGTHVSGIVGAGRNGFGMEGVAPEATLLSVGVIPGAAGKVTVDLGNGGEPEEFDIDDLQICGPGLLYDKCEPVDRDALGGAFSFNYLSQFEDVKVINGSFGPDIDPGEKTWELPVGEQAGILNSAKAMRASLDAGQIIVMAAGNEYELAPIVAENPSGNGLFPFIRPENENATNSSGSLIYNDEGTGLDLSFTSAQALSAAEKRDGVARGRIVVVVALDAYNEIAPYSNRCGVAREWCVAAPGGNQKPPFGANPNIDYDSGIYSTLPEAGSLVGSGYGVESGTSMAAPNVSGAVAVLTEAYPTFSPAEIVRILFMTAEDLGAAGVDAIYGWGLVRLDRALSVAPVGMIGDGVFTVGADGSDTTWIVSFESDGVLEKVGTGTLSIVSDATFKAGTGVEGGFMAVDGSLTTPMLDIGPDGTLGGTGLVVSDVNVGGTLAPGHSPGTLTIVGNVALAETATTQIDVDGTGTQNGAGNYDRIIVTGPGNGFAANGMIAPRLRGISGAATNTFTPAPGEVFTFVQTQSGVVSGSFTSLEQPDAGLAPGTRLDVLYWPDALSLATTPENYADLSEWGITLSGNEGALAAAIDAGRPEAGVRPDPVFNDGFNQLYQANAAALSAGLPSMTGQLHAEMGSSAVRAIGRFADRIGERQMGLAEGRLSETGTPYGAGEIWISGNHAATDVGSANGLAGYEARANNGAFGIDWDLGRNAAGIAGSYEYADISAGANGAGNIGTYQGAVYATFVTDGPTLAVRGGLSYGDLSTSRSTALGAYAATASASGEGIGGFAEVSAFEDFELSPLTLTPSATLGYRGFHRNAMNETGSLFGLAVPEDTFSQTQTTLALDLSRRFARDNGMVFEPVASLGWRYDIGELDRSSQLGILGGGFEADGADIGRNAFVGRLSLNAVASDRFTLGASYEAEFRDNLTSQVFSFNASFEF
ncbi:S8 family serine peptidase [Martelella radicis]|uniref:Outer membrane autotransporter protein n=1 Tax=Martelella radicis TaxID=1397476 RepID=A0A7W6KNL4_9HYPH|nr:S8 family serine peptidase [Martelella radicis]MBB4123170.1 outer membrane autotransporter protein [Martelella radicis]